MNRILLIVLLLTGFLLEVFPQENGREPGLEEVRMLFKSYTEKEGIRNAFFRIETADQSILLDTAMGEFANGDKVTLNTPFYTASIGKTFTATAIAQLVDAAALSFDDKVVDHLDTLIDGLLMVEGIDHGKELTIHHLLSHTSGLADYFEDQPISGTNMMQELFSRPDHFWEPGELIAFAKNNFKARFKPGEGYHYTDTEYILLGLVIEQVAGMPLHQYFEKYITGPLSMDFTSMNLRSAPAATPDFPLAEIYAGPMEISRYRSLSADWAGGAIRSTGQDLNTFMKALFQGKLLTQRSFEKMQKWIPESQGTYYGYGLRKWVLSELNSSMPPLTLLGHSGSTGAYMYFCPELDIYLSGTFNNTEYLKEHVLFMAEVLTQINHSK